MLLHTPSSRCSDSHNSQPRAEIWTFFPSHASLSVICIRRISFPRPVFLGEGSEPRHHRPLSNLESMHEFHSYSPRTSALVPPSPPPRHFAKGPPAGGDHAPERGAGLPLRGRQRAGVGRPLVLRGHPPHPRPHADRLGHRRGPTPSCTIIIIIIITIIVIIYLPYKYIYSRLSSPLMTFASPFLYPPSERSPGCFYPPS